MPGYGDSLATKYGATRNAPFKESYYRNTNEYKLDHFAIPRMMFDYIRGVNLHDGNVDEPYAPLNSDDSSLFGQIAAINLIGRNLYSDNVSLQQDRNWHRETLEPRRPGRLFTLSEKPRSLSTRPPPVAWYRGPKALALDSKTWAASKAMVRSSNESSPMNIPNTLLGSAASIVGRVFSFIEVGMLPEIFSVSQGFHQIHPKQSMRLLTGGEGYQG